MSSQRHAALDYAKGIGIVLVVYGHVARGLVSAGLPADRQLFGLIDGFVYSFHMPLFFFLSGLLFPASLARRGRGGLIRDKLGSVLYPYLVWSLIQGLIELVLSRYTNGGVAAAQVFSLLWAPRAQFWFLYTLFVIFALSAFVYERRGRPWGLGILAAAVLVNVYGLSPYDIYAVNSFCHWFVFFAGGVALAPWLTLQAAVHYRHMVAAAGVFIVSQWLLLDVPAQAGDAASAWLRLMAAFGGIGLVGVLALMLARFRLPWLEYLGRHSLEIFLAHIIAASGARIVLHKLLGVENVAAHVAIGMACGLGLPLLLTSVRGRRGFSWLFHPPRVPWLRATAPGI